MGMTGPKTDLKQMQDLKFKETVGILTHIKDLTLRDRPEMKLTSELRLKVIFINKEEEWRPEEESV